MSVKEIEGSISETKRGLPLAPAGITIIGAHALTSGIPVVNFLLGIFALASYPAVMYSSGRKTAYMLAVLSSLIGVSLYGPAALFSMVFSVVVPGLILGAAMLSGMRPGRAIALAFIPTAAILALIMINKSSLESGMTLALEEAVIQAGQFPGAIQNIEQIRESLVKFARVMFDLLPSLVMLSGLFNVFLAYLISSRILNRYGFDVKQMAKFTGWRPGYYLVGVFLLGLFLTVVRISGSEYVGWNIMAFTGVIYFISGLAVVEGFLTVSRIPLFFKLLFYAGVGFAHIFSLVVIAGVGLFDSWFNFRSRAAK